MTKEIFNKAINLNSKIKEYREFLKAYNAPYYNGVKAENYDGDNHVPRTLYLGNEPELEMQIREYVMNKIDSLEKEFNDLKC